MKILVRLLVAVVGVAVVVLGLWLYTSKKTARAASPPRAKEGGRPVSVTVAPVEKTDVDIWSDGLGNVAAFLTVTVKPQVDGRLDKLLFTEGKPVQAGAPIAEIDPRPFLVQLHQAQGALDRDESTVRNGELNLKRFEALAAQQLVATQQVTDQQAAVELARGQIAIDRASIEAAQLNLDYAEIKSPLTGVAGVRLVDPGNIVHASDPTGIVIVTQLDPAVVFVTLPEDDLPRVHAALMRGPVTVEILSRDGRQSLGKGTLAVIDNQINAQAATLRLKAEVPNAEAALWPGLFVKARILVDQAKDAVTIPAQAVQQGPKGAFVYTVGDDMTAQVAPVKIRQTVDEVAIVDSGLVPGQTVITDGQNQVRPGAKVSMAQPTSQPTSQPAGASQSTTQPASQPTSQPSRHVRP